VIEQTLEWAASHDFLGEAIPLYYMEFAANHFATFLGGDLTFSETEPGGWSVPCIEDLERADIRFRPESKWWRRTVEFATALKRAFEGKMLIAAPTLVANLDALAALRGTEELIVDMMDRPAAVHRALRQITQAHCQIAQALWNLLDQPRWGSITRHQMYSSGRISVPQCDFSYMISPEMFREFALPYLREEINHLDVAEYHLDGSGAIQHVEAVCSLEKLGVIQWQPGAGNDATSDWSDLYGRIDKLGKGLIRGGTPDQIKAGWRKSRDRRQFFSVWVKSREEFEQLLATFG
jgi:5-methyltetrahydrofolate--homocysteine methyltransferase